MHAVMPRPRSPVPPLSRPTARNRSEVLPQLCACAPRTRLCLRLRLMAVPYKPSNRRHVTVCPHTCCMPNTLHVCGLSHVSSVHVEQGMALLGGRDTPLHVS